jgi:nucleotide-binding universal stress UspA family protein
MSFFPTPVLVGTAGTAACRHALTTAAELCRATGSSLHLVHVKLVSGTLRGRPMTPAQREATDAEGQALLERERTVAAEVGVEVDGAHLRYGDRTEQVLASVQQELQAGLLVVGAGRSGTLAGRLTTSTRSATGTVLRSPGSVMVVRGG